MHFAYPPRKSSHPPPYAVRPARSQFSARRRWQLQFLAVVLLSALTFTYFLFKLFYRHDGVTISTVEGSSGSPPVVIVTVLEEGMDDTHRDIVMNNRQAYVERHGKVMIYLLCQTMAYSTILSESKSCLCAGNS